MKNKLILLLILFAGISVSAQKDTTKTKYKTHNYADKEYNYIRIKKEELIASGKLNVYMKDFDFDLKFEIISFHVTTIIAGFLLEVKNTGAEFRKQTIDLIEKTKRKKKIYFENIKVRGTDGTVRRLAPLVVKVY